MDRLAKLKIRGRDRSVVPPPLNGAMGSYRCRKSAGCQVVISGRRLLSEAGHMAQSPSRHGPGHCDRLMALRRATFTRKRTRWLAYDLFHAIEVSLRST